MAKFSNVTICLQQASRRTLFVARNLAFAFEILGGCFFSLTQNTNTCRESRVPEGCDGHCTGTRWLIDSRVESQLSRPRGNYLERPQESPPRTFSVITSPLFRAGQIVANGVAECRRALRSVSVLRRSIDRTLWSTFSRN